MNLVSVLLLVKCSAVTGTQPCTQLPTERSTGFAVSFSLFLDYVLNILNLHLIYVCVLIVVIPTLMTKCHVMSFLFCFLLWEIIIELIIKSPSPLYARNLSSNWYEAISFFSLINIFKAMTSLFYFSYDLLVTPQF